tara:strand:- start:1220 stop:1573 length:354 start_codon:yes stop_codon:yes gene_type:complete
MKQSLNKIHRLVINAALAKKAFDVLVLDLRRRSDLTDYFILCSGNSNVQVQAIADSILDKAYGTEFSPMAVEGYQAGNWIILDLVDAFVHIFHKDMRCYYDLERLWGDAPVIEAEVS